MNTIYSEREECCTDVERVGVLAVHGMGEQEPNGHRDVIASVLVRAWQQQFGESNVSDVTQTHHAENSNATVAIHISENSKLKRPVEVQIREVFWADLDEGPEGFAQKFKRASNFWCWGLSLWSARRYAQTGLPGSDLPHMKSPGSGSKIFTRAKLFLVAIWFTALGLTWELMRIVLRWLRIVAPGSGVLVGYLGDVELYTEDIYHFRPRAAPFTDRPRDAIRRRMIAAITLMANQEYDRWYMVAHSLGTVVAHNGLMEPDQALPNYLSKQEWQELKDKFKGTDTALHTMCPARPCWLKPTDTISRERLYSRLQCFITYGSPLDKFATIWPAIVPINSSPDVLDNCKWINVYDRMDPVAGSLDYFSVNQFPFKPKNVPYRSSIAFLLAHTSYLKWRKKGGFPQALALSIAEGMDFNESELLGRGGGWLRTAGRLVWWLLLGGAALATAILVVNKSLHELLHTKLTYPSLFAVLLVVLGSPIVAAVFRVESDSNACAPPDLSSGEPEENRD